MKNLKELIFCIFVVLLLLFNGIISYITLNKTSVIEYYNYEQVHPKYEYFIMYFDDLDVDSGLTVLGEKGYKVVGSRRARSSKSNSYGYEFILIKQK